MNNNEVIDQIVSDFERVKKEFEEKAQSAMRQAFTEFFKENPRIRQVVWTQYSPHFNDGDECTFSVHDMYANVGEEDFDFERMYDIEESEHSLSSWGDGPEGFETEQVNFKEFYKIMGRIPDDVYEATFGNHSQIIASREGFDVEEYEHD